MDGTLTHPMARLRPNLDRLLARVPDLGDILRGSLLHRKTFHSQGCAKCARGAGHPQWVSCFLASTEMTGSPRRRNACTCRLI